jgi:branched-chain amino acid transport system substrate-binding protein
VISLRDTGEGSMVGWFRQRRFSGGVAVIAAALMALPACGFLSQEPEPETVVIGADLALTGDSSALGEIYERALALRVQQVNQQGLLADRRIELRVVDNRSDPSTSTANLLTMADDAEVAVLVTGGCDECAVAGAEVVEELEVPMISLGAASDITEPIEQRRHVFRLGPNASDNARILATELERLDVRTVAVVVSDDRYGQEGRGEMIDAGQRSDFEVVLAETVTADGDNVAALAGDIVAYQPEPEPEPTFGTLPAQPVQPELDFDQIGPDAVVIWASEPIVGQLAVSLREQGYEGPLFLDAAAAGDLFLTGAAGRALNGARMVFTETLVIDDVIATSPARAARQTWFKEYTAQEGTYHAYSSFAADAVELVVAAIHRFNSTDRATLRDSIEGIQIDGLSGPIRIRLENHSGLSPQALTTLVAQGDRWRLAR